jgi:hypothetical protein
LAVPHGAPSGNGVDPHPPTIAPKPPKAVAKGLVKLASKATKAAEKRLLEALRENPGQGVGALARASGGAKSTTQFRLKRLEARGAIEKREGRWRVAGEEARPTPPP